MVLVTHVRLFFFLPKTILGCLSSVLENTIITLFVMKLEGVFVLTFQLSCLIALKFNVFPLPSALEIYIVFVSHCLCVTGAVCFSLCPAASSLCFAAV